MNYLGFLRRKKRISERDLAASIGIARATIRSCEQNFHHAKVETLQKIASVFDQKLLIKIVPIVPANSDFSVVAVSYAVAIDGFETWKIHFMNFVDEFRRTQDSSLILLAPVSQLDTRLKALIAGVVTSLCGEIDSEVPDWAAREYYLDKPWFVSGVESLKASAILESPQHFRRHNVFVHENFLQRV